MTPWRLVPRNLRAHTLRSTLTFASVTVAVFLVCILRVLVTSLGTAVDAASSYRLIVQSAVSLFVNLPESYQTKIDAVDGIDCHLQYNWFGSIYQNDENFFGQFGVEAEKLFEAYPELEITEGSKEDFIADRGSCVVGQALVDRFPEFKVGSTVPLIGRIYVRTDGTPWEFRIAGIYRGTSDNVDDSTLYFHHDYVRESMEAGDAMGPEGISVFVLKVAPGASPEKIQSEVDLLFENSEQRVQTTTEAEFAKQFVTMLGNVPTLMSGIGGGVVFAILLAVLNTMLMAARERTQQIGVLKALGFTDRSMALLLLGESLLLCVGGGMVGLVLSFQAVANLPSFVTGIIPNTRVSMDTVLVALGGSLALGVAAALVPMIQIRRLRPVEAFRRGV